MSYLKQAFDTVLTEATQTETWYVSLVEHVPYYGGPEEGGWWGSDTEVVAFQSFPSEALAEEAAEKVRTLANDLEGECRRSFGQQCSRELGWLEERSLDADWLPEPDGPSEYSVVVSQEVPSARRGCRQYS